MSAFFAWLAQLPALGQIPIIVLAFVAVIAAILFFVEIAPRSGTVYTVIRLAVCVLTPLSILAIAGSYPWAIAGAAVLGGLFFLLDFKSRKGAGYLFQLVGFLSPALLLLAVGLIIPTIQTTVQAF
ncbi:MAG: sugar ABC transporter permease, partial [Cryobacterium sp.]